MLELLFSLVIFLAIFAVVCWLVFAGVSYILTLIPVPAFIKTAVLAVLGVIALVVFLGYLKVHLLPLL